MIGNVCIRCNYSLMQSRWQRKRVIVSTEETLRCVPFKGDCAATASNFLQQCQQNCQQTAAKKLARVVEEFA